MENSVKHFLGEYAKYLDSSSEHLTYAALSTYINGSFELSKKEKGFLKSHLDSCPSCSSRLREVEEVETENVHPLPRPKGWTPSVSFKYSVAAALVLVLGAAITMYVLRDRPQEQLASQPPSADKSLAVHTFDPERFATNPLLDGFIERTVRSASTAKFLTPHAGDTLNVPIRFEWSGTKGQYTLMLLDNRNRILSSVNTNETHAVVDTALVSGLYYAKLEGDGNLASVTKFYVIIK